MHKKSKVAMIGMGRWGKKILGEFKKHFTVAAVLSRKKEEASLWLKENHPEIQETHKFEEILQDTSLEAVVIATPVNTHFEFARRALEAGKHVFVEKPMTEKKGEAEKLIALAEDKKRILFVGHIFLYHPVLQKILELQPAIKRVEMVWKKLGTFDEPIATNLLSHEISILLALLGKPKTGKIISSKGRETECDILETEFDFGNGVTARSLLDRTHDGKEKTVTLHLSDRTLLWEDSNLFELSSDPKERCLIFQAQETALERECAAFLECIHSHSVPRSDGKFGVQVLEVLEDLKP